MIYIWHRIIYIPDNIDELIKTKYLFCKYSYALERVKPAMVGTLILKQIDYVEGATYFVRKWNYNSNSMFIFENICKIKNNFMNNRAIF